MGHSFLNKSWSAGLEAPFLTLCEVKWCRWSPPVWPWVLKFIRISNRSTEPFPSTYILSDPTGEPNHTESFFIDVKVIGKAFWTSMSWFSFSFDPKRFMAWNEWFSSQNEAKFRSITACQYCLSAFGKGQYRSNSKPAMSGRNLDDISTHILMERARAEGNSTNLIP